MKRLIKAIFFCCGWNCSGFTRPAFAIDQVHDEIQVYNAEITAGGPMDIRAARQLRRFRTNSPEFPGGFTSNRSLQGTPEFAYGITNWWEAGFYLPFGVTSNGELLSDGAKIRSLFWCPLLWGNPLRRQPCCAVENGQHRIERLAWAPTRAEVLQLRRPRARPAGSASTQADRSSTELPRSARRSSKAQEYRERLTTRGVGFF